MTAATLRDLRTSTGLTDAQMAKRMGLTLVTYKELESGAQSFARRHELLLDTVALELAVETGRSRIATESARRLSLSYAALVLRRQAGPRSKSGKAATS